MQKRLLTAAFILSVVASCGEPNREQTTTESTATKPAAPPQSALDKAGTQQLMTVVRDYYALKDALVASDAAKADEAAAKLRASADSLKIRMQTDSSGTDLLALLDTISMRTRQIVAEKDETTEKKRIHFGHVSDALFAVLKKADLKNAGVYRQYCPMAFNDKGAYWLSDETEIRNPYFGRKMLECGEVTDSLK